MQNTGDSEFLSCKQESGKLELAFWQSFLLTLAAAAGIISLVASGPAWLTYTGFVSVIITLIWIIATRPNQSNK